MPIINQQTFAAVLPDGTTAGALSGTTVTLDESWTPYAGANLTIPMPASLTPFDPRVKPVPRVKITSRQDFTDSDDVSVFSAQFGAVTVAGLTAAFGGGTVAAITAAHNRPWVAGQNRRRILRTFDLGIRKRRRNRDGTLTLTLAGDEALLQDFAPVLGPPYNDEGGIGGGVVPASSLAEVVTSVLEAVLGVGTVTLAPTRINIDLSEFIDGPYAPGPTPYGIGWADGITAWDFLNPLLAIAGARLWCDETRVWHIDTIPLDLDTTLEVASDLNLTDFEDEITRDGEWYDAVVVRYSWTTTAGTAKTSSDYAVPGTPWSRTYVVDRALGKQKNSFTPPAGAAAAILKQISTLGRLVPVSAINDFDATPGQALTVTLPDGAVAGRLAAVTWNLDSREMRLSTRNMT